MKRHDSALAAKLYASAPSRWEETLRLHMEAVGLKPEREFQFHPPRRWRADFAFVAERLLIEVEGGTWLNGRHNRPQGFANDCEKYNQAALDGWTLLRFTADDIRSGRALEQIERALEIRKGGTGGRER